MIKKSIVFFMSNLEGGGAERVTTNIIRQLDTRKYHITLLLAQKKGIFLSDIPDDITIINLNVPNTISSLFKVRKYIQSHQVDILYTTMFATSIVTTLATCFLTNSPYLVMRQPTSPKRLLEEKTLSFWKRLLLQYSYRHGANTILAQTPEMKDEIIHYYKVFPKKVKVFFNPLDKKSIDSKIKNVTNPFNKNRINVVAAGRLTYAKAFDTLLTAFKQVINNNSNYRLHILGEDDGESEKIFKIVEELNLKEYVTFHGFQSNPYRFFYFSNLFVLSSRREGLPNALLENLYLHKPIVATDCIPFMRQLIDENNNGYIVEVDNISQLAQAILDFKQLPNREKPVEEERETISTLFNNFSKELKS